MKHALVIALTLLTPALAHAQDMAGDPAAGEKVFKKCQACHDVGEGAQNKVGPELNGVVGRPVAALQDFKYSKGMSELGAEGKTWTPEELSLFLAKPRDYVKGTKMTFAGLKKEEERADVIAYLATFSN